MFQNSHDAELEVREPSSREGPKQRVRVLCSAPKADSREWTRWELGALGSNMILDGYEHFPFPRSDGVQFFEGWAAFWNDMAMQKLKEIDGLQDQVRQLRIQTVLPHRLPGAPIQNVASIRPAAPLKFTPTRIPTFGASIKRTEAVSPPELSFSKMVAVSIAPTEPTSPPKLSFSPALTISVDPFEATSIPELNISRIFAISIKPIKQVSSPELSFSPILTISNEPPKPTEFDNADSRTCRKCHQVLPTPAALLDHAYSNCRSPVRRVRRFAEQAAQKVILKSKMAKGRLVRGVWPSTTVQTRFVFAGQEVKLVKTVTRVTI